MKKTLFSIIATLGIGLFFASCGTQINLADYSQTALVGIEGNEIIYTVDNYNEVKDEDKAGIITSAVNKKLNGNNPEYETAQDRIVYAEESLLRTLNEINGINFLDKETVISAKSYKVDTFLGAADLLNPAVTPDGYKAGMFFQNRKSFQKIIKETNADSIIVAKFEFDRKETLGKFYAVVKMRIKFIDASGRQLLNKEYVSVSSTYVETDLGFNQTYDREEFIKLYPEVTDAVITKFAMEFIN